MKKMQFPTKVIKKRGSSMIAVIPSNIVKHLNIKDDDELILEIVKVVKK